MIDRHWRKVPGVAPPVFPALALILVNSPPHCLSLSAIKYLWGPTGRRCLVRSAGGWHGGQRHSHFSWVTILSIWMDKHNPPIFSAGSPKTQHTQTLCLSIHSCPLVVFWSPRDWHCSRDSHLNLPFELYSHLSNVRELIHLNILNLLLGLGM